MKVLYIDIETAPIDAHVWGLWKQNIPLTRMINPGRIICFAAKWRDKKKVVFRSEWRHGQRDMLIAARELLNEADVVIHYNGVEFDIKWLRAEMAKIELTPPSPFIQVDFLKAVRGQFKLPSYKLDFVSQFFGVGEKVKHDGHELWIRGLSGDKDAQREMRVYNEMDTILLERLHDRLLPWIPQLPSVALLTNVDPDEPMCPRCGDMDNLIRDGHSYTSVGKFQRYRCNACGSWSRSGRRIGKTDLRSAR